MAGVFLLSGGGVAIVGVSDSTGVLTGFTSGVGDSTCVVTGFTSGVAVDSELMLSLPRILVGVDFEEGVVTGVCTVDSISVFSLPRFVLVGVCLGAGATTGVVLESRSGLSLPRVLVGVGFGPGAETGVVVESISVFSLPRVLVGVGFEVGAAGVAGVVTGFTSGIAVDSELFSLPRVLVGVDFDAGVETGGTGDSIPVLSLPLRFATFEAGAAIGVAVDSRSLFSFPRVLLTLPPALSTSLGGGLFALLSLLSLQLTSRLLFLTCSSGTLGLGARRPVPPCRR